jgi:hypothetical protein
MVLIIDGHKMMLNLTAALILWLSGIDFLILPAHSTHILQTFDVAITEPLKTALKHVLDRQIAQFVKEIHDHEDQAHCLRRILVENF